MIKNWLDKLDLHFLFIIFLLAIVSFMTLSAAYEMNFTNENYTYKQIFFYIFSIVLFFIVTVIDLDIFKHFTYYIYFICLVLLLGIILLAGTDYSAEINGALGWYQIKSVSIQPAELMKFGFILMLAKLLDSHKYKKDSLGNELFLIGKMVLCLIPIMVILFFYPDLGNMLTHLSIFVCMVFVSRIRLRTIITFILSVPTIVGGALVYLYFRNENYFFNNVLGLLPDHVASRFYGWLRPEDFPDSAHQMTQAITHIGVGNISGYEFANDYKPEVPLAYSDMIFSVVGAVFGFMGSAFVIMLFLLLIYKVVTISLSYHENYGKYIGAGITGFILFQVFQNIGMSVGILPITGISLPFISYGGSSLITVMVTLGLVMNMKVNAKKYMFTTESSLDQ